MSPELFFALQGLFLGFQAGVSPGPLTTLLVGESLNHGRRAGWRIAFIPLCTDPPVLLVILPILFCLSAGQKTVIGCIAIVGACLLTMFALKSFKVSRRDYEKGDIPRTTFARAFAINITNPNLYIGWLTINGILAARAFHQSAVALVLYLVMFYVSLIGMKLLLVLIVGSARHAMNIDWLVWTNRILGLAMLLYAAWFFLLGLRYLGWLR